MHIRSGLRVRTARPVATAAVVLFLAALAWPARAGDDPGSRRPFPSRAEAAAGTRRSSARPEGSGPGSWWAGTVCVALALAACGWWSVAARRYRPGSVAGAAGLRVVGRTSLSPRHVVYLLRAGDRVLIVGTGPQGAPSLLGELESDELPPPPIAPRVRVSARDEEERSSHPGRLDLRLGDDA